MRFVFALLLAFTAAGCSRTPGWLKGKFEWDAEATQRGIEEAGATRDPQRKGMPGAIRELATAFAPFALNQVYGGATVTITADEIITTKGGNGTVVSFEVLEFPTRGSVSLKTSEGKVETWTRTESGIAKMAEGDVPILIHFKRRP